MIDFVQQRATYFVAKLACSPAPAQVAWDEDLWPEPLVFRPERFEGEATVDPFSSVPFSAGARSCIGKRFTMLEAKLILAMMMQRYEPHSPPAEVENVEAITVRAKDGMVLSFRPRQQATA